MIKFFSIENEIEFPFANVYLGDKGAGPLLQMTYLKMLKDKCDLCLISSENIYRDFYLNVFSRKIYTLSSILFSPALFFLFFKSVFKLKSIFFPMHSIKSVALLPFFFLFRKNIYSVIHDVKPHEGRKKYLTYFANYFITIFSNYVIVHSRQQYLYHKKFYKSRKTRIFPHPDFIDVIGFDSLPISSDITSFLSSSVSKKIVLYLGRIEPYKGMSRLKFLIESLKDNININFCIAGDGTIELLGDISGIKNLFLINRYINQSEWDLLIESSWIILLPYDSATQSGVLKYVMGKSKKILATPLYQLKNDSYNYNKIYFADSFSYNDYLDKLNCILSNSLSS